MSPYYGDNRLRHHIVFERKASMTCVFCGSPAETREHTPSKVFLSKPYPEDLSVVPSCRECNNAFSSDELYTFIVLKLLIRNYYPEHNPIDDYVQGKIDNTKEGREAAKVVKQFLDERIDDEKAIFSDAKVERILRKLAICHATHDLSEGYFQDSYGFNISSCCYDINPNMTQDEIDSLDDIEPVLILPEIGSIGYEHIFALETTLRSVDTGEEKRIAAYFTFWNDVQDGTYRYLCSHKVDKLVVKIVIYEFLYAVIVFSAAED